MGSSSPRRRPLHALRPTETLDLPHGLSLAPRFKLLLTLFRTDPAVRPIDEWKLKQALLSFLRSSLSLPLPDHSDDLVIRRRPDLHKRRLSDPVADGSLHIRDFSSLRLEDTDDTDLLRRRFSEWCSSVEDRLQGIEVNVEGVKFRLTVDAPKVDNFEWMKKSWEDHYASKLLDSRRNSWRGVARRPDTIIVSGVPSRWFAEPRVSSKASMLVSHTIFTALGRIRNLNVAGDDNLGQKVDEVTGSGIWTSVQDLGSRSSCPGLPSAANFSIESEGSNLKVDYKLTWDRDGYFQKLQQRPVNSQVQEKVDRLHAVPTHIGKEAPRQHTQLTRTDHNGPRPKRFRE
ncbi:uncharacterized protein LOC120274942 [Dioscorea cayenensis subsp. rotundata]|uniref:Uncharacterized protein LOC120274942 n=1 Tax=Dioscorea cayennensis subsp. rotundata TaxID=55577 RepID=A0AB40CFD7_DIOCR|nr:uncharacterized protein LOC120274942 [Dioscorea cayenensis subsp. rotundata]